MSRINISINNGSPMFKPFKGSGGHGKNGQVREATFFGINIKNNGKTYKFDKNSMIDFVLEQSKLQHKDIKLKKSFLGVFGGSSVEKVRRAYEDLCKPPKPVTNQSVTNQSVTNQSVTAQEQELKYLEQLVGKAALEPFQELLPEVKKIFQDEQLQDQEAFKRLVNSELVVRRVKAEYIADPSQLEATNKLADVFVKLEVLTERAQGFILDENRGCYHLILTDEGLRDAEALMGANTHLELITKEKLLDQIGE